MMIIFFWACVPKLENKNMFKNWKSEIFPGSKIQVIFLKCGNRIFNALLI